VTGVGQLALLIGRRATIIFLMQVEPPHRCFHVVVLEWPPQVSLLSDAPSFPAHLKSCRVVFMTAIAPSSLPVNVEVRE
jgi:hypothetical protein